MSLPHPERVGSQPAGGFPDDPDGTDLKSLAGAAPPDPGSAYLQSAPRPGPLSWSVTRASRLDYCPRRYWFDYYGRFHDPDPRRRWRIAWLGKLSAVPLITGDLVHDRICEGLQSLSAGRMPDAEGLVLKAAAWLWERARQSWETADQPFPERFPERDGEKWFVLAEHYYQHRRGEPPILDLLMERHPRVMEWVRAFFHSRLFRERLAACSKIEVDLGAGGPPYFEWNELRMYAVPDCIAHDADGVTIYDWKTGRAGPQVRRQLSQYAVWAGRQYGVPPTRIRVGAVHLQWPEEEWVVETVSREDLEELKKYVDGSLSRMRELLVDGNARRNRPLPEESFATSPGPSRCRACPYREECPDGTAAAATWAGAPAGEDVWE